MKKNRIVFILAVILTFYAVPPFIYLSNPMGLMLMIIPSMLFGVSVFYGVVNTLEWFFPVIVAILFLPSVYIFYNETAGMYFAIYGLISAFGVYIGSLFNKKIISK